MDSILLASNLMRKAFADGVCVDDFSQEAAKAVRHFHRGFEQYQITPLHRLTGLANRLGIGEVFVKDEARRFGLNAFKVLGGSYAIGRLLGKAWNIPQDKLSIAALTHEQRPHNPTLITATDGNHGRGVAWTASELGCPAIVYMPKGSDSARVQNITATGAQCIVTELNYDATVELASELAEKNGWLLVQDTAWEGYEEIPRWIMQGYLSIATEIHEQLDQTGMEPPTHVFLQAGVGSFAAAMTGYLVATLGEKCPRIIIVEPHQANCIYQSVLASDGRAHAVGGDLDTLMAGLACGVPSTISWEILRDYVHAATSCPDWICANGMRLLSSPVGKDPRIISGESGAVGCGLLDWIMKSENPEIRKQLMLDPYSRVLLINTEGDTAPESWTKIVHYGQFSAPV